MELQQYVEQFRSQGLGVCVISYDSVEILADFAKRKNITVPLLSDPKSEIIRAFGVINTAVPAGHMWYGVPYPGTFMVGQDGTVRSKYFEDSYRDRYSAPTILLREFGSEAGTRETSVRTDHLELKYFATKDPVRPNLHLTLVADFQLKPKMHVYAPGVQKYIPIRLELEPAPHYKAQPPAYPQSEKLYLAPIQETALVFQGKFRVTQDVTLAGNDLFEPILSGKKELKIRGQLRYQACDDKICYLPQNLPLEWTFHVEPLERQRVPEAIQHKAGTASGGR